MMKLKKKKHNGPSHGNNNFLCQVHVIDARVRQTLLPRLCILVEAVQ